MIQAISMTIAWLVIGGPIAAAGVWLARRSAKGLVTDPHVIALLVAIEQLKGVKQ